VEEEAGATPSPVLSVVVSSDGSWVSGVVSGSSWDGRLVCTSVKGIVDGMSDGACVDVGDGCSVLAAVVSFSD